MSVTLLVVSAITGIYVKRLKHQRESLAQLSHSANEPTNALARWGILEPIEVPLANRDGALPDQSERLVDAHWFFEGFSETNLTQLFESCELSAVEHGILLNRQYWQSRTNGIVVTPPEQVVWGLGPSARAKIYTTLARFTANYPQACPFRFPLGGFDLKFRNSGVPAHLVERIKHLTYTNSGYLCFADLQLTKKMLSPDGFKDLVSTLYAVPTYMLRLRVTPKSDVDALVKYWGRGGREKLVGPIISSLAHVEGGSPINVSYLMPPFARLRLYTYPDAWHDPTATRQDCFFTAMNFFNETPDTNFFNAEYSRKILDSDYAPLSEEPSFGDVVALFDEKGDAVHACVFIADDFVYTKNGVNPAQPWVIMRMQDMLMIYFPSGTGKMVYLRRKNIT